MLFICHKCFHSIFFTSTELNSARFLMQFHEIQGWSELLLSLHSKNMPNYTQVKVSTLS